MVDENRSRGSSPSKLYFDLITFHDKTKFTVVGEGEIFHQKLSSLFSIMVLPNYLTQATLLIEKRRALVLLTGGGC